MDSDVYKKATFTGNISSHPITKFENYCLVGYLGFMAYQSLQVIWRQIHFYANSKFYFKQFSLAWVHSLIVKTFLFQANQFSQTVVIQLIQFSINTDYLHR